MATDNDLAALLPDPPPPRPARREAAIAEAMRRFDGEEPSRPETARPKSAPTWWRQPQLAALASIALVVTISLPVWWLQRDRISEVVPQRPTATAAAPGAAPPAGERNSSLPTPQAAPAAPESSLSAPAGPVSVSSPTTGVDEARLEDAPTPAQERASAVGYAAQRQVAPEPPPPPPPPPAPAAARGGAARAAADEESDYSRDDNIVVTGSRISRPDYNSNSPAVSVDQEFVAGGNWNACTILDEDRNVRACPTRRASGRAAAQLSNGLNRAWDGDMNGAISAFSSAIRTSPDFSQAYLNRGLAYQAKGDLRRALSDLNQAVANDPNNASAYHYRSEVQRALGNTSRAEADEQRAEQLTD